jgi:hypothetical protein
MSGNGTGFALTANCGMERSALSYHFPVGNLCKNSEKEKAEQS